MNRSQGNGGLEDHEIQREREKLDEANKKQEHRIRNMESKAVQNVNLYFIFQAVVLASTTTTTSGCHNWWILFSVSLLAAITNLHSYWTAMMRVLKSREELDQNLSDLAFMNTFKMTRAQLDHVLPGSPSKREGSEIVLPKVGMAKMWKRRLVIYLSVGLFVGFSVIIMYGCYNILCRSEKKCVKLC